MAPHESKKLVIIAAFSLCNIVLILLIDVESVAGIF
jgi:hypothetical protein